MATKATWQPHDKRGRLTKQSDLPDRLFAFPTARKEPLTDAQLVRKAVARFDQTIDVSGGDRALASPNHQKVRIATSCTCRRPTGTSSAFTPAEADRRQPAKAQATRRSRADRHVLPLQRRNDEPLPSTDVDAAGIASSDVRANSFQFRDLLGPLMGVLGHQGSRHGHLQGAAR
jgi:hypothetical protein